MRGWGVRLVIVLVAAWAATGCSAIPAARPDTTGCAAFQSMGVCEKQVDAAIDRHPGAQEIELTCTAPVCDRASGSGTVTVTQRDGSVVTDTFAYQYDGGPMPEPACAGVPGEPCRFAAAFVFDGLDRARRVEAISVSCPSPPCVGPDGAVEVLVRFADGATETQTVGTGGGTTGGAAP